MGAYKQKSSHGTGSLDAAAHDAAATDHSRVDPVGNDARIDDAGLQGGLAADEYGLAGEMADLVLECLPMDAAVGMARDHLDNPAVLDWVDRQDPLELAECIIDAELPEANSWWPIGTGVQVNAMIGAGFLAEGDVEATASTVRSGTDALDLSVEFGAKIDASAGGGAAVKDAFGDAALASMVKGQVELAARDRATATVGFDLLDVLSATSTFVSARALLRGALGVVADSTGSGFVDQAVSGLPEGAFDHIVTLSAGIDARLQNTISVDALGQLVGTGPILAELDLVEVFQFLAQLDAFGEGAVRLSGDGATASVRVGSSAFTSLVQGVARIAAVVAPEIGRSIAEYAGTESMIELSVDLGRMDSPDAWMVAIESGKPLPNGTTQDRLEATLASWVGPEDVCHSELRLADAVSVEGFDWTREVRLSVDSDRLDDIFPSWLDDVANLVAGASPGLVDRAELWLEGKASIPASVLAEAAAHVVVPPDQHPLEVLSELADAVANARWGWRVHSPMATRYDAVITAAAARLPDLGRARLTGRVALGAGGELSAKIGGSVNAAARANAGFVVDRAVEGLELARLRMAVGA